MFEFFKTRKRPHPPVGTPVPKWRPGIVQPIERIIDRVSYYTDQKRDFAVFANGTCVVLTGGLPEVEAESEAVAVLAKIFNCHPDMKPRLMNDGNILVRYNHPAVNVVLSAIAAKHWGEIERHHQDALATHEVLISPLGQNVFDDLGKKALFGRCFIFMDALSPRVIHVVRASA